MHGLDEDPSEEDQLRFGDETGYCPDCGREIWDEAWQCPHCEAVVEGRIDRTPNQGVSKQISQRSVIVLVLALIVVLVFVLL